MKRNRFVLLALACSMLVLSGCYRVHLPGTSANKPERDPDYDKWQSHFVFGLAGTTEVDQKAICPQGVEFAKSFFNGWQGLVSGLTLGIYTPNKYQVWCVGGQAAPIGDDPNFVPRDGRPH